MDDFKSLVETYSKEEMLELIQVLKKRVKELNSKKNLKLYNRFVNMTKDIDVPPIRREIELAWCKERYGLITSGERNKIIGELLKKLEVESEATQQVIDLKLSKLEDILKLQGSSDTYIQHSKLCKLRALGIIDEEEERTRISNLYK